MYTYTFFTFSKLLDFKYTRRYTTSTSSVSAAFDLNSITKILWTQHCLQRMQERDISRDDVKNGIATGEIIEEYPDDFPNPSCLIFGYNVNDRILHIVAGCDNINIYIITAYYPDTRKFEDDLKTRRKR